MSDTISRQAVLNKFQKICNSCGKYERYNGVMCRACEFDDAKAIVEDEPSAQPEQCEDAISRQAAIDARRYTFGNDEFSLEAAYHDCKLVFDGITDDDSFQEADTGLILYYANEIIYALQEALEGKDTKVPTNDCISRQAAIDAIQGIGRLATLPDNDAVIRMSAVEYVLFNLPSVQPEPLTDKEQRIFLSAMSREEEVCKQVDDEWRECREPYDDSLVKTCHEITRKVKGALWT